MSRGVFCCEDSAHGTILGSWISLIDVWGLSAPQRSCRSVSPRKAPKSLADAVNHWQFSLVDTLSP